MKGRVEQVVGFCFEHWREIGITSIVLHLLVHEVPMLLMILFGISVGHGH